MLGTLGLPLLGVVAADMGTTLLGEPRLDQGHESGLILCSGVVLITAHFFVLSVLIVMAW
jgi:hypothetical protein